MGYLQKQNELKLKIMEALVRSQGAVASLMEGLAETARLTSDDSASYPARTEKYLREITRYQQVLAARMLGISVRKVRKGKPASPWLASDCIRCSRLSSGLHKKRERDKL